VSLYDRSVDLQVRLEAAHSADSNDDLVARGRTVSLALDEASKQLERVAEFRTHLGVESGPGLDAKKAAQAVRSFRAGLSKHGALGFQHQPATNLLAAAKELSDRAGRWAKSIWRDSFNDLRPLLDRADDSGLVGEESRKRLVRARAQTLRAAERVDPVREPETLVELLGGARPEGWLEALADRGRELREGLDALDRERSALTPEVQDALRRATSEDGLPVSDLTAELLAQLRAAGVESDLVVRRS